MKKSKLIAAIGLMLITVMAVMPLNVEAIADSPTEVWTFEGPGIMVGGKMVSLTGTEAVVDLAAYPAPAWLELLSKGLTINAPAEICHPFQKVLSGWVGEIRQLKDGKWVKLPTTSGIGADTVHYYACAQAYEAGTYALFGYYIDPTQITPVPDETVGNAVGMWQVIAPDIYYAGKLTPVTGKEMEIDLAANPAPAWRTLFSEGLQTTSHAKICHPFRLGSFDWVGEIYQLKGGKWVKLPTTNAWAPLEVKYMSCAQAPEAGVYALFGIYRMPTE